MLQLIVRNFFSIHWNLRWTIFVSRKETLLASKFLLIVSDWHKRNQSAYSKFNEISEKKIGDLNLDKVNKNNVYMAKKTNQAKETCRKVEKKISSHRAFLDHFIFTYEVPSSVLIYKTLIFILLLLSHTSFLSISCFGVGVLCRVWIKFELMLCLFKIFHCFAPILLMHTDFFIASLLYFA